MDNLALERLSSIRPDPASLADLGAAYGVGSPAEAAQQPSGLAALLRAGYEGLGGLAKRAFGAAAQVANEGIYNPAPILEAATLPMGTGAIAGLPLRAGEAVLGAGPIRAYHGSPHDFDKFSLSKIGTGEGAQAYGHGLYFAEKEGTAKAYREALSGEPKVGMNSVFDEMPWMSPGSKGMAKGSLQTALSEGKTGDAAVRAAMESLTNSAKYSKDPRQYYDAVNSLGGLIGKEWHTTPGRMYEVNIKADPEHFLDWDKPLSQQSEAVKQSLLRASAANPDIAHLMDAKAVAGERGNMPASAILGAMRSQGYSDAQISKMLAGSDLPAVASSALSTERGMSRLMPDLAPSGSAADNITQGIPGIKYLDQGSRAAGEGSRNYVVFDDSLIDILKKYGLAGVPAAGALYSAAPQDNGS